MKKHISLLTAILAISSCSTPKYTYHFDYYDYNSGKKKATSQEVVVSVEQSVEESTLTVDEKTLVASANESEVIWPGQLPSSPKKKLQVELNPCQKKNGRS